MPLKPEVTTSPYGALLIVGGILLIGLGAMVLPAIGYAVFWGVLVLLGVFALFYVGQRVHRRLLGTGGGR